MTEIIIKNQFLEAHISTTGAEVRKLLNSQTKHNYMWSGDSSIWSGVSPVLFPVVGKTTGGEVRYQGKSYPQGNHGFARSSIFTVAEQTEQMVRLKLDAETVRKNYPFNLDFEVVYTVIGGVLTTQYIITNHEKTEAYFSIGAHPAFACPFDENHKLDDYYIEFSHSEANLQQHEITPEAFFTGVMSECTNNVIDLNEETFVKDAIIFDNYKSRYISLKERNSDRHIKVSLDGFKWLGIWSKVNAKYVCIEPWCGHSDYVGFNGDVNEKAAIEIVSPLSSWVRSYSIEFAY